MASAFRGSPAVRDRPELCLGLTGWGLPASQEMFPCSGCKIRSSSCCTLLERPAPWGPGRANAHLCPGQPPSQERGYFLVSLMLWLQFPGADDQAEADLPTPSVLLHRPQGQLPVPRHSQPGCRGWAGRRCARALTPEEDEHVGDGGEQGPAQAAAHTHAGAGGFQADHLVHGCHRLRWVFPFQTATGHGLSTRPRAPRSGSLCPLPAVRQTISCTLFPEVPALAT